MATVRGRIAGNNGSTTGTTIAPSLSTGWTGAAPQTGDIVFITGLVTGSTGGTWSQTAGTGTWVFQSTGDANTGASFASFAAWRIFDGTETDPTFTYSSSLGTRAWALVAVTPAATKTISIDLWSAVSVVTVGATTFAIGSATASGTDAASLILGAGRNTANASSAITPTPPSSWTGATSAADYSGFAGGASTRANIALTQNRMAALSGAVSPANETVSSTISTCMNLYQVLLVEAGGSTTPSSTDAASAAETDPTSNAVDDAVGFP